jgi:hypothetical protein
MELNWLARRGARSIDARLRRLPFQFMLRGSALGRISFVSGVFSAIGYIAILG